MAASEIMRFYNTGVPRFDKEHLDILTLLDEITYSQVMEETIKKLDLMLEEMVKHTKAEELFMEKMKFPHLKYHQAMHNSMLNDFTNIIETIKKDGDRFIGLHITKLSNILKEHIEWLDIPYGEYANQLREANHPRNT